MSQSRHRLQVLVSLVLTLSAIVALMSCQSRDTGPVGQPAAVSAVPSSAGPSTEPASDLAVARAYGFTFAASPGKDASRARNADFKTNANAACVACHEASDNPTMHVKEDGVNISCADCHGGRNVNVPPGLDPKSAEYDRLKQLSHVQPLHPEIWKEGADRQLLFTASMQESPDFIRFINPGDLRASRAACASCHNTAEEGFIVDKVSTSMMTHGAMLWSAALYNNGSINRRQPLYAEAYGPDGTQTNLIASPGPTTRQYTYHGMLPGLLPLPRWEITQPGNVLRVFERGAEFRPIIGLMETKEPPGKPDVKLSLRGYGTDVRTDPVFIGLQKTRLLDPTLNLFGSNDHPGDYRSSGCSGCHVAYANDRSKVHSAMLASYGNRGESFSVDRTINPSGTTQPYTDADAVKTSRFNRAHPIQHTFQKEMNTAACVVCHIHPGTNVLNSYLGYMWWDNESDGQVMYPAKQRYPTSDDEFAVFQHNPEGSAVRGLWSNLYPNAKDHHGNVAGPDFLENLTRLNKDLKHVQFADFHGHGWVFRAVFKQDRHGNMLDYAGKPISEVTAAKMKAGVDFQSPDSGAHPPADVPVHLKDIHLEKGMQCVDCHFKQDAHGDGNLYGETRNAVMVTCEDCHGTAEKPSAIFQYLKDKDDKLLGNAFTGNAALDEKDKKKRSDRNKLLISNHFAFKKGLLVQKSALQPKQTWVLVQTNDTTVSDSAWAKDKSTDPKAAQLARFAHTVRRDPTVWGSIPDRGEKRSSMQLAHSSSSMSCYACHSSWNTSCFGCHLPQRANQRKQMLHNEGALTRNYTNYNYQTLRDDVYMLGVDSTVKDHKVVPIRSACAVLVASQDANRQWIYTQQQTVSAEGYAGTAFSPYFPHTVRAAETKQCGDCHVHADPNDKKVDNNAIMAQLLLQGTNSVNFIGRFAWVGKGNKGLEAVVVTERDEPQAVIGSRLHELAYPDYFSQHKARGLKLAEGHSHDGDILDVQLRGEYLYAACGEEGFIAYDIANIDNKGFSERIITAPVSPLGQRFYVHSKYATSICSPSTMALDPTRKRRAENEEGVVTKLGEQTTSNPPKPVHPLYAYLYLTDREEGLVVIGNPADSPNKPGVSTLLDGDPDNNFLERALAYNPNGLLNGARHMDLLGTYAYISCDAGIVVLDMDNPLHPRLVTTLSQFSHPKRVAFQFRYGFVVDDTGIKVLDVTFPEKPREVGTGVDIADARDLYICRTYGYVAAGHGGLVVLDMEKPEAPKIDQRFNDEGRLNDCNAVRVGMTNASLFAYIADGRNGLKVLQLTSPDDTPTYLGFSPRPAPRVIAYYPTDGPALALSEGLDRDRAVDESGNQLSVFGRRGARPFTLEEQQRLYLQTGANGERSVYTVSDEPWTKPLEPPAATKPAGETPKPSGGRKPFPGKK